MPKLIEGKHLKPFAMLPCKPGVCQECATDHEPHLPHNAQSLFYQYRFYNEHGRWPNWGDAMAHCDQPMKDLWHRALTEKGVKPEQLEVPA